MYKHNRFRAVMVIILALIFTMSMLSPVYAGGKGTVTNSAPVINGGAESVSVSTNENQACMVNLNASDANRDTLIWSLSTAPQQGTAALSTPTVIKGKSQVTISYTPNIGYSGTDSFVAMVDDKKGGIDTIIVKVAIIAAPKPNNPPANTAIPSISGTASVGKTLTASAGTWIDPDNPAELLTYTYQWQWKDAAGTIGDIAGAAGSSYTIAKSDIGKAISVKVTVKDTLGGSSSASSDFTAPVTITKINYVALGDSIATGTIYPGTSIKPYVDYFHEFLIAQNPNAEVTLQSYAANGDRTNELGAKLGLNFGADLAYLYNPGLVEAIKGAEIITISIGGNNLMQAAKDESALGGYNFNNIDDTVAQQGVADFNSQWRLIIEEIKNLNPNAQIIWYTMYNPYNESDAGKHNQVDSYLFRADGTGINDIIAGNTALGYSVAQVYQFFNDNYANNMGEVTYFYPTDFWGMLTRNPHPKAAGQNIISELHKQLYKSINY